MSFNRILDDRRTGLEEAFFAKKNRELQQKLHEKVARENAIDELRSSSSIEDEAVLEELYELGISSETVAALELVPLVQVAWADGRVDPEEKEALLKAAAAAGVDEGSASYEMLEGWLREPPGEEMLSAWREYVAGLAANCSEGSREALKAVTLGRAEEIAEAAGGFLGVGRVSASEKDVLASLAEAFSAPD